MRSARRISNVISIDTEPHFWEYAEPAHLEHTEEGPVEKFLREDKGESWQLRAVYMAGALFVVMYVIPAMVRAMR